MKICKDCKHAQHKEQDPENQFTANLLCAHPECADVVTGEPMRCRDARGTSEPCGRHGALFETNAPFSAIDVLNELRERIEFVESQVEYMLESTEFNGNVSA